MGGTEIPVRLERSTFRTSRLLDFANEKELTAQTGHPPAEWPLVVLKELVDNELDACEEAEVQPIIAITVNDDGITISDNGPGLPSEVIDGVLDFAVRTSSREAYIAPDRGAQGNALKTLIAMPYVLDGRSGVVEIEARGICHTITFSADPIRQVPVINLDRQASSVHSGTHFRMLIPTRAVAGAVCPTRRRFHLAEPAPLVDARLVRRAPTGCRRDQRHMGEVAAVRSDVGTLVWGGALRAADRRLPVARRRVRRCSS